MKLVFDKMLLIMRMLRQKQPSEVPPKPPIPVR